MRDKFVPDGVKNTDNYLALCDVWREKYLALDRDELCRRFGLEQDEHAQYIVYFNQKYRIDQSTGMITLCKEPGRELSFDTVMVIYHLFWYSKKGAHVCGRFVPFRQVKRAAPFDPAFRKSVLECAATTFEGHTDALNDACLALGGKSMLQGDVGYKIDAFSCMPLEFIFWDGDDEFPAQANILFDADITDFIHEETVVMVGSELIKRLVEESGLFLNGRPF